MHQTMTRIKHGCEVHPHASSCPAPVTEQEFAVIAERALASAVQLMACSCEQFVILFITILYLFVSVFGRSTVTATEQGILSFHFQRFSDYLWIR